MLCKGNNCNKYSTFNFEGLKPRYCYSHKLLNMINVKTKHAYLMDVKPDHTIITKMKRWVFTVQFIN